MTFRINGKESYVQNKFKLAYLIPFTLLCSLINCYIEKTTEPLYIWWRNLKQVIKYD